MVATVQARAKKGLCSAAQLRAKSVGEMSWPDHVFVFSSVVVKIRQNTFDMFLRDVTVNFGQICVQLFEQIVLYSCRP